MKASVLIICCAVFSAVSSVKLRDFKCGTNRITTLMAYKAVSASCPAHIEDINECCSNHDECYNDQAGRNYCDTEFCDCLMDTQERFNEDCDSTLKNMCFAVKAFGDGPYRRSNSKRSKRNTSAEIDILSGTHANISTSELVDLLSNATAQNQASFVETEGSFSPSEQEELAAPPVLKSEPSLQRISGRKEAVGVVSADNLLENIATRCEFDENEKYIKYYLNIVQKCSVGKSGDCCSVRRRCLQQNSAEVKHCNEKFCHCVEYKHALKSSCHDISFDQCLSVFSSPSPVFNFNSSSPSRSRPTHRDRKPKNAEESEEAKSRRNTDLKEYMMSDFEIESVNLVCKRWQFLLFVILVVALLVGVWWLCHPDDHLEDVIIPPPARPEFNPQGTEPPPPFEFLYKSDDEDDVVVHRV